LVGAVAGWAVARLLVGIIGETLITLQFVVPASDVLLGLLLALVLSTIGGIAPALGAARLRTVEVLRYE